LGVFMLACMYLHAHVHLYVHVILCM